MAFTQRIEVHHPGVTLRATEVRLLATRVRSLRTLGRALGQLVKPKESVVKAEPGGWRVRATEGRLRLRGHAFLRALAEIAGLLFQLVLTGCGYSNPDLYRSDLLSPPSMTNDSKLVMTCDFQGIGRISSEVKLDCGSVERNFWLGSEILGSRSILSADEYARIYNNYEILVLDHNCVDSACNYLALYHAGSHPWSEMEPSMIPMLHEQLHHLDTLRGEKTANHENWDVKGFWAADKEFQQRMTAVAEKIAQ